MTERPILRASQGPLLRVQHVSKTFSNRSLGEVLRGSRPRTIRALDAVSFEVAPGQVTGLLGPNGAGKTTLISILCDLVHADSGTAVVAGARLPEEAQEAQRRIGLVTSNERSFFWRLSGRQNLEFFAALQDLPRHKARLRVGEVLTQFGLDSHAERVFRVYSAGMKKRLTLARALLHDPPVLFMDEPTNSLDAAGADDLIELVKSRIRSAGKSVLWATHRMDEVEKLCDRVVVLMNGKVRFDDGVDRFRDLLRVNSSYVVELDRVDGRMECLRRVAASLQAEIVCDGSRARLRAPGPLSDHDVSRALLGLLEGGLVVRSAEFEPASLKALFIELARES
ncbi:MAG: ABC transporter ATP-binding protein [Candidatus Latescibacteria bacterium]|nr:ABC transporter ATP-binding protein [Candidatus Latescibacterota bacterium]